MKYKFFRYVVLTTLLAAAAVSCQKFVPAPKPEETPSISETGKLVSAVKISSKPITDAIASMVEAAKSNSALSSLGMIGSSLAGAMFDVDINDANYTLDIYRIKYTSIGGPYSDKGNYAKTEVYGDIAFVRNLKGSQIRQLESVSMFHTLFNTAEQTETLFEELIMPTRAAFNALVVYPLYQGVCGNSYTISPSEHMIKARQAIDCERAALEFIRSQDDIDMMPDYYTEAMAMSNGCGTAIATQFLLENAFPEVNAKDIRLKSTYCSEGCYAYSLIIPDYLKAVETPDFTVLIPDLNIGFLKTTGFVGVVIGAYDTWKTKYFEGVEVEDFFSEEFLNIEIAEGLNPIEAYRAGLYDYISNEAIKAFKEIKDIINPALILPEDRVDVDAPCMRALLRCFPENEQVYYSRWYPATKLCMAHSIADEFIKFSDTQTLYSILSNSGSNSNVTLEQCEYFGHLAGTFYFVFKNVMFKKHPVPLD